MHYCHNTATWTPSHCRRSTSGNRPLQHSINQHQLLLQTPGGIRATLTAAGPANRVAICPISAPAYEPLVTTRATGHIACLVVLLR